MEYYEGTSEPNLDSIPALLDRKAPDTLESALIRIGDLRTLLGELQQAYARSQMETLQWKLISGFLGCMTLAFFVATILGVFFEG